MSDAADGARRRSRVVRVLARFECRRVLSDRRAAPAQIIIYPAGWSGRMPAHHVDAGLACGAIQIEEH